MNTAQAWKGGAGFLQWQVETVVLWVFPAPPGVSFLFYAYTCRLTLEKVPVTVGKDPLTTGKVLLTVGKTTKWNLLTRACKTIIAKARLCMEWHCIHLFLGRGGFVCWVRLAAGRLYLFCSGGL